METRQKTEYKLYVLELADMRGNVDKAHVVAVFENYDKLVSFYNSQLADAPYVDEPSPDHFGNTHSYSKVFKKGSTLEWYNAPMSLEVKNYRDRGFGGVGEDWVDFYPTREQISSVVMFNPT